VRGGKSDGGRPGAGGSDSALPSVVLRLPRCVLVRGQVVDSVSHRPVAGAKVWCVPRESSPLPSGMSIVSGNRALVLAGEDGKFELPMLPGEGTILSVAPSHEYVPVELDAGVLAGGKSNGKRIVAHTAVPVTAALGVSPATVFLPLTLGETIEGFAVREDGSPVPDGRLLCRHIVGGRDLQSPLPLPIRNGRFAIPGCRPGRVYTFQVIDPVAGQGAVAQLLCPTRKETPTRLRLSPLSDVSVELVTPVGLPVGDCRPAVATILTSDEGLARLAFAGKWWAPETVEAATGPDGRVLLRGLIPGASYQLRFVKGASVCYAGFDLKPGKALRFKAIMPEPAN
jgi:hypothetical protein